MLAPEVGIERQYNGFRETPDYSFEAVARCWISVRLSFAIYARYLKSLFCCSHLVNVSHAHVRLMPFQTNSSLNTVEFRSLRCIALAMRHGESRRRILSLQEQGLERFKTQGSPSLWLSRLWPSPSDNMRRVKIPDGARSRTPPKPGDIGFWRTSRRGFPYFKVLCNVKHDLLVEFDLVGPDFKLLTSTISPYVYV